MCPLLTMAILLPIASVPASPLISCNPGPYIIFFEPDTSVLKREQVEILGNVLENANDCGSATAYLTGHADTAENPKIVKDRLRAVRTYFAARGLFVKRKNIKDLGATQPRITTGPNVSERQNRRVQITYGPQSL